MNGDCSGMMQHLDGFPETIVRPGSVTHGLCGFGSVTAPAFTKHDLRKAWAAAVH